MHDAELRTWEQVVEVTGCGGGKLGRSGAVKIVECLSIAGGTRLLLVAHPSREHTVEVARDARVAEQ